MFRRIGAVGLGRFNVPLSHPGFTVATKPENPNPVNRIETGLTGLSGLGIISLLVQESSEDYLPGLGFPTVTTCQQFGAPFTLAAMARKKSPDHDAAKLQNLLQTLDKLRDAGFIKHHIFLNDQHTIQFTERGLALVKAIQDLEAAIPKLSAGERSGLWHLFRMAELGAGHPAPPSNPPAPIPADRDQPAAALRLAEAVSGQPN